MRAYTVRELNLFIKNLLDSNHILSNIWVKGEISNFKRAVSGHLYFTLKDQHGCIKSVMFRSRARSLVFQPDHGMAVLVRGYVSVFERDGSYQLYVEEIEPDGAGALYLAYEQLKEKLQREGLFDKKHKKALPLLPLSIGIVTSPTGAVIRDMVGIIRRRWPGVDIYLVPVAVQGESAPSEIARGIDLLNSCKGIDLIIIGRGGGSLEELWAFNTEQVARSIYKSSIPVISAVGHETDYTIADLVADVRAATPSAAAELAVPVKQEMDRYLYTMYNRMFRSLSNYIDKNKRRLEFCMNSRSMRNPVESLCGNRQQVLDAACKNLYQSMNHKIKESRGQLALAAGKLQALSPLATLSRGYSISFNQDSNEVLYSASQVASGQNIEVILYRGRLLCRVMESEAEK